MKDCILQMVCLFDSVPHITADGYWKLAAAWISDTDTGDIMLKRIWVPRNTLMTTSEFHLHYLSLDLPYCKVNYVKMMHLPASPPTS